MAVSRFREAFPTKAGGREQSALPHGPGAGPPVWAADPTNVSGVHDAVDQRRLLGISGPGPTADDDESGANAALWTRAPAAAWDPVPDAINQSRNAGIGGPDPGPDESGTDEALRATATATVQIPDSDPTEDFHQPACQPSTGPVTRADQRVDWLKYTFRLWVDRPDATMSKRPSPSRSASVRSSQAMPSSSTHTFIHRFPTGT